MTTRTDHLPSEQLFSVLGQAKLDLDAFKERQRTSAQSGVLAYFTQSASTWDIQTTIGTDADTSTRTKDFFVTFTGDGAQNVAFGNLSFNVFVNGTDSAHGC